MTSLGSQLAEQILTSNAPQLYGQIAYNTFFPMYYVGSAMGSPIIPENGKLK